MLKGKKGIIFGALNEQSIAWKVAEKAVEEGATITLSNTPVAVRMGEVSALSEKLNCEVIPADATSVEDLENVFKRSMEVLGGPVDFVLHSIGMSPNVRKKRTYDDLDYDMLEKTLDISAVSFHKMIQAAKKLNAIADYGSVLALSYVAAQRTFYGYNDMADAKALLESIARSFGYIYGREHHVRVNTISQSPTMTTAGSGVKGMDKLFDFANRMSPLGNASADECADYCIVMFSDLTRKVTMQNLFHDGGFSSVGMSLRAMATYEKGLDEYKDENGNIRPYHLGHYFIAIDTEHFLGEDIARKKAGEIIRSVRNSKKAPDAERIYTAGEKEYEIWKERENSGVPITDAVQQEIIEIRNKLGLDYVFPWEEGYTPYPEKMKASSHIERK